LIHVTKTYLPDLAEYTEYLQGIWDRRQLTNNGPLVVELEQKLAAYLGVKHCLYVSNGTIAIQLAIKALNLSQEIVTTPFSYCATSHSILWENCTPVFADIDPRTLCIDPARIEAAITERTEAILATHVYGNPCEVEKIEKLAQSYGLKVIYDGAHAFGVRYKDRSLLSYGDFATCSFHATKVFHTIEGGAVITNSDDLAWLIQRYRSFGHVGDEHYYTFGINGKNSEFNAAMGLINLKHLPDIIEARRQIFEIYDSTLSFDKLTQPEIPAGLVRNYSYYPVFFRTEQDLLRVKAALEAEQIFPRRYFYPSLSTLKFVTPTSHCPESDRLALCALALPLFADLPHSDVRRIAGIVNANL
jgi:dTDP-4-amino-4,6-dideoxygalactose transaminase